MLSEKEIKDIKEEAERLYPETDVETFVVNRKDVQVQSYLYKREGFIAGATSQREKVKPLLEALEEISIDHYPETVFKPISEDEWSEFVRYVQRKYTIDSISGYYGRFFHKINREIAKQALTTYNQK